MALSAMSSMDYTDPLMVQSPQPFPTNTIGPIHRITHSTIQSSNVYL